MTCLFERIFFLFQTMRRTKSSEEIKKKERKEKIKTKNEIKEKNRKKKQVVVAALVTLVT